MSTIIWI
ncbi:hypothetical protein CGLO_18030 [Colletotrichum gloeosporioides Cg-14]|nr:hypothetical protein CGLO_18030 [Colletotrichum gloeosporioides Cg-14]